MKRTALAVFLALLATSACTSMADVKGPFARLKGATQTDAGADEPHQQEERSPFPQATDHGLF